MNIALLTAAGSGTRMNQDIPKQFMHIDNKPLIIYTLEAFQNHPNIDVILVVCLNGWREVLQAYANQFNITKLKWIVPGGETGQESIYNGLKVLEKNYSEDDIVLIHDGNRALVSFDIISDSIAKCKIHGDSVAVIPCTEAVFRSENQTTATVSIPRENLFRTQTPHTYPLNKLMWAHEKAKERNITNSVATCTLMAELGETIHFSKGSEKNMKITTVEDIDLFKSLLKSEKEYWLK
ncbi:IspD/TarI family cytidylyltransferase [Enterococcus avium]|uniref:IspD/TarI family cytidylyltransferase n=1 Tax=Enterococcus avium TaxID=33945 RepID=UPI003D12EB37